MHSYAMKFRFDLIELPVEQVDMIMSIAPSAFDSALLKNMQHTASANSFSDNALFIMQVYQML